SSTTLGGQQSGTTKSTVGSSTADKPVATDTTTSLATQNTPVGTTTAFPKETVITTTTTTKAGTTSTNFEVSPTRDDANWLPDI
ncbi:MAG: hypothetical protein IKA63_03465, partial [Clostridia bacterium]|nr:hypothetical protein [Clostridia bacterium]